MKIDEILEKLDRNGYAPFLINNDNGEWAVSCDGMQQIFDGIPSDEQEFVVFALTRRFRPTIKEAVEAFLEGEEIDIDALPYSGD